MEDNKIFSFESSVRLHVDQKMRSRSFKSPEGNDLWRSRDTESKRK